MSEGFKPDESSQITSDPYEVMLSVPTGKTTTWILGRRDDSIPFESDYKVNFTQSTSISRNNALLKSENGRLTIKNLAERPIELGVSDLRIVERTLQQNEIASLNYDSVFTLGNVIFKLIIEVDSNKEQVLVIRAIGKKSIEKTEF